MGALGWFSQPFRLLLEVEDRNGQNGRKQASLESENRLLSYCFSTIFFMRMAARTNRNCYSSSGTSGESK